MKTYSGRVADERDILSDDIVTVTDDDGTRPLDPRLDLRNHSPTGFAWGYGGSGPAQLALALCADALGEDAAALRFYIRFKFKVVATWPQGKPWSITADEVCRQVAWINEHFIVAHVP